MRILWITNVLLPPVCKKLGLPSPVSGGWLQSSAEVLSKNPNISLSVVSPYKGEKLVECSDNGVIYYCMPTKVGIGVNVGALRQYWEHISATVRPDVIHIHGTEFTLGYSFVNYYGNNNVVASIQGLTSIIAKYYLSDISYSTIYKYTTLRDLFFGGIIKEKKQFERGGWFERELLKGINHVIGRTTWDFSHVKAINPEIEYHFCNETLRESFASKCWRYDRCKKYTIFLSQCNYPIKGLHIFLKALEIVKEKYPNVQVRIAGKDFVKTTGLYDILKRRTYGNLLNKQLKKYGLLDHVEFTGVLDEEEMGHELLNANLFVCPSSIENSSNSICEAQMVGTPVIASYVGGTPDLLPNSSCGYLYRFEEYEMLASLIIKVFKESCQFDNTLMRETARSRHDKQTNFKQLMSIYQDIVCNDNK